MEHSIRDQVCWDTLYEIKEKSYPFLQKVPWNRHMSHYSHYRERSTLVIIEPKITARWQKLRKTENLYKNLDLQQF